MTPSPIELALVDRWQRDFPLARRPFAIAGRALGLDENGTIATFERLQRGSVISRIGAVVRPHTAGASTLAAMRVPPERLDEVAAIVSAEPLVNHNYERVHAINLWFVVAGPDREAVAATLERVGQRAGMRVLELPLLKAYHLDLGFPLVCGPRAHRRIAGARPLAYSPDAEDRELLAAMQDGLPLTQRPYREVGHAIGLDEIGVIGRLRKLTAGGVVTRLGCIVRHRALGYTANAMAVWDVPDAAADEVARRLVRHPRVTLCYRRRRHLPDWPYNLFCMVHARTRHEAGATIDELDGLAETGSAGRAVLFSSRCFKQRGAVFSRQEGE